jgi:hypothetical protein
MSTVSRKEAVLQMNEMQGKALERLLVAAEGQSGQTETVADFLLGCWDGAVCGRFDLTSLWGLDPYIAADIVTDFGLISQVCSYPDQLGYEAEFKALVRKWRPLPVG